MTVKITDLEGRLDAALKRGIGGIFHRWVVNDNTQSSYDWTCAVCGTPSRKKYRGRPCRVAIANRGTSK